MIYFCFQIKSQISLTISLCDGISASSISPDSDKEQPSSSVDAAINPIFVGSVR